MANTQQQLQMHHILSDGSIIDLMPVTTSLDVQVGSKSNGSLTLPGSSASEILSDTISNIRKYLYNLTNVASTQRGISTNDKDTSEINLPTTKVTTTLSNAIDALDTRVSDLETTVKNGVAPTSHASSATTYGQATGSLYGHAKLSDTYASKTTNAAAANGIAASQNALANAYSALDSAKAPKSHTSGDTTYGAASGTVYGHVKTQGTISTASTNAAEVPTQAAVKGLYDTVVSNKSSADTALSGKAPTSHASSATTYGVGTTSNYGHLKINDQYSDSTSESTSKAANAVAASSWAVYRAYNALNSAVSGKAPTSHASTATTYGAASGDNYGHVKLSDNYSSSAGAASSGIGASSKAVYDAYAALSSNITTINSQITSLGTRITTLESEANNVANDLVSIYTKCVNLGTTPSSTSASDINTAIQTIYNNRYTTGYNAGVSSVNTTTYYNNGYSAGQSAGYSSGYSAGISDSATYGNYYGALKFLNSSGAWGGVSGYNSCPKIVVANVGTQCTVTDRYYNTYITMTNFQNQITNDFSGNRVIKNAANYGNWYNLSDYGFTQSDICGGNYDSTVTQSGDYLYANFTPTATGLFIGTFAWRSNGDDVRHWCAYFLVIVV